MGFLQKPTTDKDDDHRKPVESKESPEYLARSLTADEAEELLKTYVNGSKDDDYGEPVEVEDPLVSLVTQQDPLPKEDLIKMFPEEYLTTASKDPKVTPPPPQDGIDALMNFANNDQAICPTPSSPAERTSTRGKRKQSNNDEVNNSKSPKLDSRSTTWRKEKRNEIQEEEEKLESLKEEIGESREKITCLFGALAQKRGKLNTLETFKKEFLVYNFPKFFYLDKKDNALSRALQDSQDNGETRGKMAEYLKKLEQNNESKKQLLDLMEKISGKLLSDINNNNI